MIHPSKMRWLFFIKSVVAVIASFALLGWAVHTGGPGPVFAQKAKIFGSTKSWAWVYGINVAISGKTTLALNIVSLTAINVIISEDCWKLTTGWNSLT